MILYTDFEYAGDVGPLVRYMERHDGERVPVKTPDGRALSDAAKERFLARSRQNSFERHLVLSPDPDAHYSEREIDRRTRQVVREWLADKPSVEAVYCVHRGDPTHAHVAATGAKRDLAMYRADLRAFEQRAAERFREPQRLKQRDRQRDRQRAAERALERERSDHDRGDHDREQLHREAQLPKGDQAGGQGDDRGRSGDRDQDLDRSPW